jgi:hypothetical protein
MVALVHTSYLTRIGTFAAEIYHDVFEIQLLDAFVPLSYPGTLRKTGMLANLLAHRTTSIRDADGFLPKKINDVLDFLLTHSDTKDENTKERYACILRKAVAGNGHAAFNVLRNGLPDCWKENTDHEDAIAAVAAIGDTNLIKSVLPLLSGELKEDRDYVIGAYGVPSYTKPLAQVFGNAVAHTLYHDNLENIKLVFSHVRANVDKHGPAWSAREGHFRPLTTFIREMIRAQNITMLEFLLDWQNNHLPCIAKCHFNEWLEEALETRHVGIIDLILHAKIAGPLRVSIAMFTKAVKRGNTAIIKALLGKGRMPVNGAHATFCPLNAAIMYGTLKVITSILDSGALINGPEGRSDRWMRSPVEEAIRHKRIDAVELLINRGASTVLSFKTLKSRRFRSMRKEIYELIRQDEIKRNVK